MTVDRVLGALLGPDDSLMDGLRALELTGKEIALVCDEERHLLGTLTDGDVRRALLRGCSLESTRIREAMNMAFTTVEEGVGRAEVLDLMRARGISQIPVVVNGVLVGLHTIRELIGYMRRPNWAVVMAGGKGTRLRPITAEVPKPMVKVAGRPMLERLILHLVGYGIHQIFLSINYLGHIIEQHFGDGSDFGCEIQYLRESEPLGTAGGLSLLPARPEHPLLVMNGDLVTQANVAELIDFHTRGGYAATVGLRQHRIDIPFGVAETRADRLVRLDEKPSLTFAVNAGMYVISPATLDRVPAGSPFNITDLLQQCLDSGTSVGAHLIAEDWADVGRPDELRRANGHI